MINALTTNKTDFFREQHHFDYLRSTVFPMLEQKSQGDRGTKNSHLECSVLNGRRTLHAGDDGA
jgi:chemotaxis protein methyltransferase CheR